MNAQTLMAGTDAATTPMRAGHEIDMARLEA